MLIILVIFFSTILHFHFLLTFQTGNLEKLLITFFLFFLFQSFLGCTIYFLWLCKLPVLPCPVMIAVKRSCLWAKNSKDFLYNFSLLCAVHSSITFFITLIHEFKILQFSQKVNSFSMHSFCDTNMHQFLHQITFVQRL